MKSHSDGRYRASRALFSLSFGFGCVVGWMPEPHLQAKPTVATQSKDPYCGTASPRFFHPQCRCFPPSPLPAPPQPYLNEPQSVPELEPNRNPLRVVNEPHPFLKRQTRLETPATKD